jgi:hypothetical protein
MAQANLYPPVIDTTFQDAFLASASACTIIFGLSNNNSVADLKEGYVQVSMTVQSSNKPVFKNSANVILKTMHKVSSSDPNDRHYAITISEEDLTNVGSKFEAGIIYKIQLRFTGVGAETYSDTGYSSMGAWIENNKDYFSEWSAQTLIKAISTPVLQDLKGEALGNTLTFNQQKIQIAGQIVFEDNDIDKGRSIEYLQNYSMILYSNGEEIYNTGILRPENFSRNEINYTFPLLLDNGNYLIYLTYNTNSGYSATKVLTIVIDVESDSEFTGSIFTTVSNEEGQIRIDITGAASGDSYETLDGTIVILRASADNDFTIWDTVASITLDTESSSLLNSLYWIDTTPESDVWYKYGVQRYYINENTGLEENTSIKIIDKPVSVSLEDCFLVKNNTQLKLRFDPSVTNFRRVVKDSVIETIGSKYPFVIRNGHIKYHSFSYGGLISCQMDNNNIFTSYGELFPYETLRQLNLNRNSEENINSYNDYLLERKFREKVMDFLTDPQPFLFRSPTEGNMIVKLTDVSFTPNATLGRMIYSFSGSFTEVADNTVENYDYYDIQNVNLKFSTAFVLVVDELMTSINNYGFVSTAYGNQSTSAQDDQAAYPYDTDSAYMVLTEEYLTSNNYKFGGINVPVVDDVIDFKTQHVMREIPTEFDSSKTYAVGDYVGYEGEAYKCIAATGPGSFDSSAWKISQLKLYYHTIRNS